MFPRKVRQPRGAGALVLAAGMAGAAVMVQAGGAVGAQASGDAPDLAVYARIRDEGQTRSRAMQYATELIDGIGARLTGSPNLKKAVVWASERLKQMGLSQVREESWGEFGVGWEQRNVWVRMVAPDTATFIAHAAPWSPPTRGPVTADVVAVGGLPNEDAFARHRGTLRGRIVLLSRAPGPPDVVPFDKPLFTRLDDAALAAEARELRRRLPAVRAGGDPGADVQARSAGLRHPHASHQYGHVRASDPRRPAPGRRRRRDDAVQRRDAGRAVATPADARAAALGH